MVGDPALDDGNGIDGSGRSDGDGSAPVARLRGPRAPQESATRMNLCSWTALVQIGSVVEILFIDLDVLSIEKDSSIPNRRHSGIFEP
jgi:hypothetical protein